MNVMKIYTAMKLLEPGLYLTQQMFAFISMLSTLASCLVHQTLTWFKHISQEFFFFFFEHHTYHNSLIN